jgi:hypothetical protein
VFKKGGFGTGRGDGGGGGGGAGEPGMGCEVWTRSHRRCPRRDTHKRYDCTSSVTAPPPGGESDGTIKGEKVV